VHGVSYRSRYHACLASSEFSAILLQTLPVRLQRDYNLTEKREIINLLFFKDLQRQSNVTQTSQQGVDSRFES